MKVTTRRMLIGILTGILLIMLVFLGANIYLDVKADQASEGSNGSDTGIKIGFSLGTLKEERWIKDRDILMAMVRELGADIIVQNANNDDEDQLKQVRYLLDQNIDVLIIVPNDLQRAAAAVQMAQKEGVKVISYDRLVLKSNVDLYISFDNEKVGELMARHLLEAVPEGNYLIINGAKTDNNTRLVKEGYSKVLNSKIESGDIKIIAEEWADDWLIERAFRITDVLLQQRTKIDAILAGNDGLAGGAIRALAEYRLAGKTKVVGQDADLAASQRIVEGSQLMTVYKPIDQLARATAELAIKLAKGEKLDISTTIFDGKYDIPYYFLEPIAVDKDNIDETIIKDGFHRRDEVYRNLKNE
ncbi:substrate-binding domain-containing protein [Microaerobacter geothermalis]|uniref:sugar ABC transporter substrate-binding protein n=1 Tax=Microaerobacter geothermalis TaxID=674972 RepID=UPI001F2BB642|nr:substrate-binding domain-containing protein [Microaerobacter geothermalis]MCF6092892.1 substrate-binding domain-containing protein [Microaerobacter geothermalis]